MRTQIAIPQPKQHCRINRIAIFGSADVDEQHPLYQETFKLARYLAYHHKVIVDGGGPGTMLAATRGAQSVGGQTVTVTFDPHGMSEFEGQYAYNKPSKEIRTANYVERMFGLLSEADAYICMRGGTGTLSEWSTAWLLAHLYYGNHKPLILYGEFWQDLMTVVIDRFLIGDKEQRVYRIVKDEAEMIVALNELEVELRDRCGLPETDQLAADTTDSADTTDTTDSTSTV
ncbi:MAG: hypothetical protein COU69_03825 [Candidatus Pacebacteria bacterium CG10_big_fil_rev_8_21_14_0_10_56_10]|nr:MAG: hypothetical protein COU69_03825 [Candidatus Pacebacteria bacterium CG10_big_fil_rev_8_21_14_0_10_56_10]